MEISGSSRCELYTTAKGMVHAHYEVLTISWSHGFNSRLRRAAFGIALTLSISPYLWSYLSGLVEDEDVDTNKAMNESKTHTEEDGQADEAEAEIGIPETMPEDAIFIPLGFARQRPETYYKATDPEWQSFIEYRKDREREPAIKSALCSLPSRKAECLTVF